MTADDLTTPLGQQRSKRRWAVPVTASQLLVGVLALLLGAFVLWAVIVDDPFGGEPMTLTPIHGPAKSAEVRAPVPEPTGPTGAKVVAVPGAPAAEGPAADRTVTVKVAPPPAPATKTITIIDGTTGERREVTIPAQQADDAGAPAGPAVDQKFLEATSHGPIPRVAADGTRPAEAFARPVSPIPGKPDAPRIAIVVGGLGVSTGVSGDAITKLPGPVTLGFLPYADNVAALAGRARAAGHEILLQLPMEPFDYPDNDPGPQTLLTSLAPQQNIDRLHWLMSRFQGYVGVGNAMGARFTASESALAPILHEAAKRGLIYVDDGSNPRSLGSRIAGTNSLPFAKADVVLDAVPTPAEIDRALGRLEVTAREHGFAVGAASALPSSIDRIAKWAKAAESRGLLLVPITTIAARSKQT